ncbi:hypothetical protein A3I34_00505 [Candidatus Jorgensenbacteria bacterium RIFCSPLOWO2_02_FULL_45_12]|nr:MAG: hypothetical protein A3I34_00505 [Candidatus Jorgensenbacteria bacterium RIFCSPLOWO2_02_FULL_45_12]
MRTMFFTGDGDGGESAVNNKKISKSHSLLELLGELDKLNSILGWCAVEAAAIDGAGNKKSSVIFGEMILKTQEIIFMAQSELGGAVFEINSKHRIEERHTEYAEGVIKIIDAELPQITKFIIAGGVELAARLDIARAKSRKVERLAVRCASDFPVSSASLKFFNRLSAMLFALARYANYVSGIEEQHPTYSV